MWASVILTLGCMGKQRVGFLAGRVRVTSDEKGDFYTPRHLSKLRCFFILLGCGIILCNVAIIGPGLNSMQDATLSTRKLTRDVDDLATQGLLIMDGVSNAERNINKLDMESLLRVEEACPNLAGNVFLNDKKLKSSIATLESAFNNLQSYVDGSDFEDIRQSIDMIMEGTSNVDALVTEVEMNDWIVKMFVLFLNALVCFMIVTTLVSLSGRYLEPLKFITMMLVFPAFVILISSSWIAAAFISFLGISNADFCNGPEESGPDGTVNNILKVFVSNESIIFKAFTYFQSGCATEDPIKDFYKYEDFIQTGISSAQTFLSHVDEVGIDKISSQCGASVSPIIEGIGLVKDNLGILLSALRSTFDLASCSKMTPIYKHAFEGTACTDSAGSLIMMFSLMLGVGVIGMLMIMLRAAMYPCKLVFSPEARFATGDDEDEWEEYQAYLRYMSDFLSYWGDKNEEPSSVKKEDDSTKSSSSSVEEGLPDVVTCETSSSWEVQSFPPSSNPDYTSSCKSPTPQRAQDDFDDELQPLSPKAPLHAPSLTTPTYSLQHTSPTNRPVYDINDECQPLSPDTPAIQPTSMKSESRHGRLRTPDFLSPGTFRRWRRNDVEDYATLDDGIPETPLMVSPKENGGTSYLSKALNMTNFMSPLEKRVHSPGSVENPAKNKYF
eukprot:CCRYP_000093-RB/>CCRYP_000093-RB protein AED:0.06 eAED:0.06 QI:617/1/1/1/1/0.85/7/102/667